jgi:hypothetical protein
MLLVTVASVDTGVVGYAAALLKNWFRLGRWARPG